MLQLGPKNLESKVNQSPLEAFTDLVWQYLPSVLITAMYAIFPSLFKTLAGLERYYPATEQNVTIARYGTNMKVMALCVVPIRKCVMDVIDTMCYSLRTHQ